MTYREVAPILEKVETYFGTNHLGLTIPVDDDQELDMEFFISKDEIKRLFTYYEIKPVEEVIDTLWLNANAGYDRLYEKVEQALEDVFDEDVAVWNSIKRDIIELHKLFDGKHNDNVKVTVGKKSVEVTNWFQRFFHKYCYSELIDDEVVYEPSKNRVGTPAKDELMNSIVCGIGRMAKDYRLVRGKAPKDLCLFIWKYLELMKIVEPDEVDDLQIRQIILRVKAGPLYTPKAQPATSEDLKKCGTERHKIDYLTKLA